MSQTRPSRRRIVGEYAAVRMGGRALRDARGVDRARSPRGVRIAPNPQHGRTRARTGDAAPFTDADTRAPRRGAVSAKRSVPTPCPRPSARVVGGGGAARDPTRTDGAGDAASSAPTGGRKLPGARDRPAVPRAHHAPAAADRAKPRLLQENTTSRSACTRRRKRAKPRT